MLLDVDLRNPINASVIFFLRCVAEEKKIYDESGGAGFRAVGGGDGVEIYRAVLDDLV